MIKKLSSLTLSAVMLLSAAAPAAFAQRDAETEKILLSVKERVDVPEECSEFESSKTEYDGDVSYFFSWSTPPDSEESKYLNVECTDDEVITEYYYYQANNKQIDLRSPGFPKSNRAEVLKRAQDFADELNPQLKGSIIVEDTGSDSLYGTNYYFSVRREENGIPVNTDGGNIGFDGENEYVTSFYMNWTRVGEFPSIDKAISKNDAQKAFAEKIGMELVYDSYADDNNELVFYPKYMVGDALKYINALTGEVCEPEYSYGRYYNTAASGSMAEMAVAEDAGEAVRKAELSDSEIAELEKISGLISRENIEKSLRSNEVLNIPDEAELVNVHLSRKYFDKDAYVYNLGFESGDDYISVSADAKSGEIISYRNGGVVIYGKTSDDETDDTNDRMEKANEIFEKLAPEKYSEYEYTDNGTYVRMHGGIKVICDTARVELGNDGELSYYAIGYTDKAQFPSVEGVISAEKAADALFEATDYNMVYMLDNSGDGACEAVPVYRIENYLSLNPFTGQPIDYRNEPVEDDKPLSYTDIDGHYAKKQIEKLAEFDIGFEGGEFKPDEKIKQAEFVELISKVFWSYHVHSFDELYSYAVSRKLLKDGERDDEAEVTRETAAVLFIRAIGADEYAEYEDIYVTPFKDVETHKGYIALLSAMGIVEGDDDGNFNPQNSLSRAEAAIMLYNYLSR